jgi:hypothetical protein
LVRIILKSKADILNKVSPAWAFEERQRKVDKLIHRETGTYTHILSLTHTLQPRQRFREAERQRGREAERQRDRETER